MEENKNLTGIVLQAYDVRDSSRMVDILTLEEGRLSAMVRGAKRNKSRFLNLSAPYVEGDFHLVRGRSTNYLKEGTIRDAHFGLRRSLGRLTSARFGCEALMAILPEGEDANLYYLVQAYLKALEEADENLLAHGVAAYFLKLCSFSGFRPRLSRCIFGGESVDPEDVYLDYEAGGIACSAHATHVRSEKLSRLEYEAIGNYIRLPLRAIMNAREFYAVDGRRLARICFRYYVTHTERRTLGSLHMMEELCLL